MTLGTLFARVLPPAPKRVVAAATRQPRQKRYRDYVRKKRRR
jgi:hypothetical protein